MQETQETWVRFLGWEDLLEKEMATLSGILVWKIPWTEEPGELQYTGSQSWTLLSMRVRAHTHTHTHTPTSIYAWISYWIRHFIIMFNSVTQSCPTLCDPMNCSTPGLPVHHQLPEFTQTHVHQVGDAIQPSHPLSSPSPPAPNPSEHQSLFQWVNSSHEVAKVLEFQL